MTFTDNTTPPPAVLDAAQQLRAAALAQAQDTLRDRGFASSSLPARFSVFDLMAVADWIIEGHPPITDDEGAAATAAAAADCTDDCCSPPPQGEKTPSSTGTLYWAPVGATTDSVPDAFAPRPKPTYTDARGWHYLGTTTDAHFAPTDDPTILVNTRPITTTTLQTLRDQAARKGIQLTPGQLDALSDALTDTNTLETKLLAGDAPTIEGLDRLRAALADDAEGFPVKDGAPWSRSDHDIVADIVAAQDAARDAERLMDAAGTDAAKYATLAGLRDAERDAETDRLAMIYESREINAMVDTEPDAPAAETDTPEGDR